MKRRSVESYSPRSKRQKNYDNLGKTSSETKMDRSPLRPLSVMEETEVGPSPMRGIAAGLSPAVKYADRTRKFKLDNLQTHLEEGTPKATTRRSPRLTEASKQAVRKLRNSDENDDDIVVRLRAKLDARKKRREQERAELDALSQSSSNSDKSGLSGISEGSNPEDDAELRAAKTASAKRRVLLNRKSKFRMSVVKKVAEARQTAKLNSPRPHGEPEEEDISPKEERTVTSGTRRARPKSSSSSDDDVNLRRSKRTGRPSAKRQAKLTDVEESTFSTPKSSKGSRELPINDDSQDETGRKISDSRPGNEMSQEGSQLNRTLSVSELKGSGLVSSVMKGFEKKPGKEDKVLPIRTPRTRPLSKTYDGVVSNQQKVNDCNNEDEFGELNSRDKEEKAKKKKKASDSSEDDLHEDNTFRSELKINIQPSLSRDEWCEEIKHGQVKTREPQRGEDTDLSHSLRGTTGHIRDAPGDTAVSAETVNDQELESENFSVTESKREIISRLNKANKGPAPSPLKNSGVGHIQSKTTPSNTQTPKRPAPSPLNQGDQLHTLKSAPSKPIASSSNSGKRLAPSPLDQNRIREKTTSVIPSGKSTKKLAPSPPKNEDVKSAETKEPPTGVGREDCDFPEGTPCVKDMLEVWKASTSTRTTPGKGRRPAKLRRQSLENTPNIKEVMKKFHDSVQSSGGRCIAEEGHNEEEKVNSPSVCKPEVIPEVEESATPEMESVKPTPITDTPLTTREHHSPIKLASRWRHGDEEQSASSSTPVRSTLHTPGGSRHAHLAKVSFSPFVKTRTIHIGDIDAGPSEQNVSVSSASVSGSSVGDDSFERMVNMNQEYLDTMKEDQCVDEEELMETDQEERYHTQPVEGAEDDVRPATVEMRRAGMQRHHTQPITSSEKENAEEGSVVKDGGIASRLAQLHKSGEENWKKRIGKKGSPEFEVKMRVKAGDKKERPTSIADRLSLLEGSKDSWRDRIEESDARQFTVAGKLELTGKAMTPDSPLLARKRKPKVPLARESESSEGGSTPSSPTKPGPLQLGSTPPTTTSSTTPKGSDAGSTQALSTPIMHVPSSDDEKEPSGDGPVMVDVPNVNDETLTDFFQSRTVEQLSQEKVTVTVDDFDHVFMEAQDILSSVQKAKPQMRRATASRNPLKTLAQRRDIQSEYIEIRTDIADREMKRIKREQIAGSACYATEALAGLAAKENFAQVMLRKTDSFTSGTPGSKNLDPFKEIMLLQVKGRRHCQIRLVSPEALSLNSGDCFILVCPERCWVWIGEFCNVIERAKAVEVAGIIQNKRDLGCKSPYEPTVMEERAAVPSSVTNKFWEKLGGYGIYQDVGPAEEDEVYEADMAETTRVYRLVGEEFVLWDEVSGCVPRYEMLTTKDILIFDFGSELYLWTGKQAAFPKRKVALKLAKEMWSAGYDYTTYGFNPMCPLIGESQGGLPLTDSQRPDWTLFGKVNQNMETILFREKFFDWPDASRLISVKAPGDDVETKGDVEMVPADVSKMLDVDLSPVSLVLEGSHVGRGNTWTEMYEGLKREYEITTLATKVWHVNEFQVMDIDEISYGHFHDGDTYVVRWQYMIMQTGMKTLKGADARHSLVGRERCAYFFWQGRDSSVNEKGASALMTVELDEERGPQIRVVQDKEPPCFLNLFKSKMVVHIGKRESADTCTQGPHRLYIIRNELKGEAHLTEVKCELTSLRSRGSFVLINVETGKMLLWNGSKAGMNTKQRALEIAQNLKSSCPLEMGIKPSVKLVMTKMDEGLETEEFWKAIKSTDISVYVSMLDDVRGWSHMPRLFCLTSVSGEFKALEIINPCRSPNICSPFPFIQTDLYTAQQPALFMLDNNHELYLWQGWWPEAKEDAENVNTGSAVARFITDRKCALQTVLNYCQAKNPMTPIPSFVVYGGLEPKIFTNLFPYWENNEEATASNLKEGKKPNERTPCKAMLNKLVNTRYTFDQLQERPLPDGVDPLRLEDYLKEDEFERVLGMSREEFQERPRWKQDEIKKEHSLF